MTPPATQTQPDPLDDISLSAVIRTTMDAIAFHPDAGPDERAAICHFAYMLIRTRSSARWPRATCWRPCWPRGSPSHIST